MNLDDMKSLRYLKNVPELYREMVKCWYLCRRGKTKASVTCTDINKQTIWGNKYVTFENKATVFANWNKKNYICK
jgi:hypothetical protein